MAQRIGRREDVAVALVRLVAADLSAAQQEFRASASREERIHRVRQRLKRVRAILRVLEPAYGEGARSARRSLTEAARMLAGARDADAAAASARGLAAAASTDNDLGFTRVASTLGEEAERAHHERTPIGEVNKRLAAARALIETFNDEFDGSALMVAALRRTYAKGSKAMRKAETSLATPDLHRWRKAAKELWYLTRLARRRLPKSRRKFAPDLARLGEVLGHDNDHALLAEKLALSPTGDISLLSQLSLIASKRRALEAEAFSLGARLYRRKPKKFARKLKID